MVEFFELFLKPFSTPQQLSVPLLSKASAKVIDHFVLTKFLWRFFESFFEPFDWPVLLSFNTHAFRLKRCKYMVDYMLDQMNSAQKTDYLSTRNRGKHVY